MKIKEICKVKEHIAYGGALFGLVLEAEKISAMAQPGQFVHIACGEGNLLRRPISICDAGDGLLKIVFAVKGDGTKWLSERKAGDELDILGPIGHGFDLSKAGDRPVLIGGLIFLVIFDVILGLFFNFTTFETGICTIGMVIFLGFTAYDTQMVRNYYYAYADHPEMLKKVSIFSALQLYLDFINLFLYLLRLFGNRD